MGPMGEGTVLPILGTMTLGVCLMDADTSFVIA